MTIKPATIKPEISSSVEPCAALGSAPTWPVLSLVGWTLFVWGGRIRNLGGDQVLGGFERVIRYGLSISFVALALGVGAALWLRRSHSVTWASTLVDVLAGYSIVVWVLRVMNIVGDDHPAAFTIVHVVLGAVSVALGAWCLAKRKRTKLVVFGQQR